VRVVVADDEPLVRSYLRSLIAEALPAGGAVLEAGDGKELARLVLEGRADAAFVDIRMPKMDGFAAVTRSGGRPQDTLVRAHLHSDFAYAKRALELAPWATLSSPRPRRISAAPSGCSGTRSTPNGPPSGSGSSGIGPSSWSAIPTLRRMPDAAPRIRLG
jgi:DNA-binding LytR/AlgR family response regulator